MLLHESDNAELLNGEVPVVKKETEWTLAINFKKSSWDFLVETL